MIKKAIRSIESILATYRISISHDLDHTLTDIQLSIEMTHQITIIKTVLNGTSLKISNELNNYIFEVEK